MAGRAGSATPGRSGACVDRGPECGNQRHASRLPRRCSNGRIWSLSWN